ncbi:hypothetical protein TD95_003027 [Thielaviopsis punctulata]|uniref:tRNA-splicing endonuclease subunit Sen34 n=1 Tax=Thielaviopsis punctulata TaxID=72032 RepID=A0A0F4ZDM5_9PEZI|nr:hypothetical protein TD95_003027 [Thielaviopsis punctulata]
MAEKAGQGADLEQVRISRIGARYLVFDYKHISRLRRDHNLCAVLVGTTPQNPSQNIFQGVPLEIGVEEASGLVSLGAGYIVDELQAHLHALDGPDSAARSSYLEDLDSRRRQFSSALEQDDKRKKREAQSFKKSKGQPKSGPAKTEENPQSAMPVASGNFPPTSLTPASSQSLVESQRLSSTHKPKVDYLWRWLQANSFYMTPGLRFGSHYSVYPGDPLRYHAHYLANSYEWSRPVPLLDLVGNGRLGTAVKKGFLIGGQAPDENGNPDGQFRAFTVEWAAM